MRAQFDRLGRPDAISWVTGLVTLILLVPSTLISSLVDFSGREIEFLVLVIARVGIMFIFFAIGKGALVRFAKNRPQPMITLATFVAAILIATSVFDLLLVVAGFSDQSYLGRRLNTTFVGTMTALILSSLLVSFAREFSRSNSELVQIAENLATSKAEAGQKILDRQAQLLGTIKEPITQELAKLGDSDLDSRTAVMQSLIDDVVRPLSYSLNRDFPVEQSMAEPVSSAGINWNKVADAALNGNPFRWLAFPISVGLISTSFLVINFGTPGIFGAISLVATNFLMTLGFWRSWLYLPKRVKKFLRGALFSLAHVPIGFASSWVVNQVSGFNLLEPIRVWSFIVICLLLSWTVTLVSTALKLLKQTNEQLVVAVEEIKREVIAINNSYRQLHRGVSRVLHGPVQEAVVAAMLRLKAQPIEATGVDYAKPIRKKITSVLELLNQPAIPATDLSNVFSDLEELWSEVVAISFQVSDRDLAIVGSDLSAAYALAELTREACSNAIRHGKANSIQISVRVVDEQRAIDLVVENDGLALSDSIKPGLGSQLFDEQTLAWSRKRIGSRTVVQAKLPLGNDLSTLTPKTFELPTPVD